MSGFEVARLMRLMPGCATIPIIAVSGYARDVDHANAKIAGFTELLAKPLDLSHLESILQSLPT